MAWRVITLSDYCSLREITNSIITCHHIDNKYGICNEKNCPIREIKKIRGK